MVCRLLVGSECGMKIEGRERCRVFRYGEVAGVGCG